VICLPSKQAVAPIGIQGWLTPIRACAGDATHWLFSCRCGVQVTRKAKDVRKSVKLGRTPACESCAKALKSGRQVAREF